MEAWMDDGVDAVRSDGGLVHIRSIRADDRAELLALDRRLSDRSIYLRFFSIGRHAADVFVDKLLRPPNDDQHALVAVTGNQIVGVVSFERVTDTSAEIAVLVDDAAHHQGIGTLLVEYLASLARRRGITRFVAEILSENAAMINVVRHLGFNVEARPEFDTVHMTFDLDERAPLVAAVDRRESAADVASMRPVLAPRTVAVVGASTRPGSVGHEVLRNILQSGFTGDVYAVNPKHDVVLGVECVGSPRDLPAAPDLAVVAVPAAHVLDVVQDCGKRGAHGVVLLSAGFGESGEEGGQRQRDVLATARRYGMRVIGPNCLGVVNTDPSVRLNATFAPMPMTPGRLGLVSQSGALGIAMVAAAEERGLGISQFVSVGNKADVSGNDLLMAWEADEHTSVIGLYLESFGNPRKFARIARRISRAKPIIAIKAGRSPAGQRAGLSHTAAAASSDAVVDALFANAGVLRVDTMEQMLDVARVIVDQPLPNGPRLAIVGNSGGPGILAADAATAAGLTVVQLDASTAQLLRRAVPTAGSWENPVDLGAGVPAMQLGEAVRILLDAPEVDMVLTVFTDTLVVSPEDVIDAVAATAATASAKPVVLTHVGGAATPVEMASVARRLPVFTFPEPAVAAIGWAYRAAQSRGTSPIEAERPKGIDVVGARGLVADRLAAGEEWLGPDDVSSLLVRYGVPVCPQRVVSDVAGAVRAAAELGYPVAAKLARGAVHKADVGGVRLAIEDDAALRAAFAALQAKGPADVLVQPMAEPGTEIIVGAVQDAQFGPVVMVGAGGVLADMIADRQLRLAPLTVHDAEQMVAGLRTAPLLDGYRGAPVVSRPAVQELLLRIATLADDLPDVAELDLNPVICRGGDDLVVVDAKVRVAASPPGPDPVLRSLRG
jgi:acetyl coenzyme A synthetase (ADP forming)-like protein